MPTQPLRAVRLYEQIAAAIRGRIVAGELKVGQRLPTEREVAARYRVSRNVVREAMRALANDGLIEVRQGSGTYVVNGTAQALGNSLELAINVTNRTHRFLDLLEVRQLVEPGVAALAAERATSEDLEQLREEVAVMDGARHDVDAFVAADHRFHLAIAKASGNVLVPVVLHPIVDLLQEQRKRLFALENSAASAQSFHHRILNAIESHNARAALAAMRGHLLQVSDDIARLPLGTKRPAEVKDRRRARG